MSLVYQHSILLILTSLIIFICGRPKVSGRSLVISTTSSGRVAAVRLENICEKICPELALCHQLFDLTVNTSLPPYSADIVNCQN